jgi:glycosyltransferase involved in cell wall biosynthesis
MHPLSVPSAPVQEAAQTASKGIPLRITLLVSSLGPGGAERAAVTLARGFAERGHTTTVVTLHDRSEDFYQLPCEIPRVTMPLGPLFSPRFYQVGRWIARARVFRRAVADTRPDIVLSFLDELNVQALLSLAGHPARKFASVQIDLRRHRPSSWRIEALRRLLYPFADGIVVLDREQVTALERRYPRWKLHGIPNPLGPIPGTTAGGPLEWLRARHQVVGMGRLAHQKGFDLLIEAFAKVAGRHPDWNLVILGEGPLRESLERQVATAGLSGRVLLPGLERDPFAVLRRADLFAFSSRYEGQGMALVEALACGLPAVSFDCPSGPATILRSGVDGLLVPPEDVGAFAAALDRLMSDDTFRQACARRAPEAAARFSLDPIVDRWEQLFRS